MNSHLQLWLSRIAITFLLTIFSANIHAAPPTEYEVKAAFIHNIARLVEWPVATKPSASMKLCILGHDSFGDEFNALQGKPINDAVWEVLPANPQTNLRGCRVLFIADSEKGNLGDVLAAIKGSAVLTIGDTGGYAEQGVIINFYPEQNKVRFEVNKEAARRAGFKISSQLLKLARLVQDAGGAK